MKIIEPIMGTFGDRINKRLKELGMYETELAEKMGINRQNVNAWTNNKSKPKADDLAILASILEVSTDWLLTGKNKDYTQPGTVNIALEEYAEYMKLKNEKLEKENASLKNIETIPNKA